MPRPRRPGPKQRKGLPRALRRPAEPTVLVDTAALRHPVLPLSRLVLRDIINRIFDAANLCAGSRDASNLELRVTSDQVITKLHRQHLGGAGPTNVLSFPEFQENASGTTWNAFSGAIVISVDAVLREAILYGQAPREHFIRLLTHAMLHLAGFSHSAAMDELTDQVVAHFREHPFSSSASSQP
ncbi:MAG: rRNA maturation RNase YbeY [Desulfovibrionales bacterium]|nr:MAG: rRNA maturation RNase YbeY [Desulfovibrionales bacterium]